jgi:CrcB protein
MWKAIAAVSVGASLGALLRWWLGLTLNQYFPDVPPGTLAANLIGGYVVGVAVAVFASDSALAPFSAEVVTLMQQGRAAWALAAAGTHLIGSVIMTFAGIGTVLWVRG